MRIPVNGIHLDLSVAGPEDGPLALLLHGFPELAYSWRHQTPALTSAGWRVAAPDLRGYGESDAPPEIADYAIDRLVGDVTGIVEHLGAETAVVIGHDWGADLAWKTAWLRPDRVRAVAGLSVPFAPRAPAPPLGIMRAHLGEDFYMVWFQEPGVAEAALGRDVRRTLATPRVWNEAWAAETGDDPPTPPFMSDDDLAVYVQVFERTGFRGGLNWYRNLDRNWEVTAPAEERRIDRPACFITGERDPVRAFMPAGVMRGWVTDLRVDEVVPGAGHWVNQQAPDAVNEALLAFLGGLD